MPKIFPLKYAIGKDLDIFVSNDDFQDLQNIKIDYFKKYNDLYLIKLITKENNFRLRIEEDNNLHYQIDITINDEYVKNKNKKDYYYILSHENEINLRYSEDKKNNNKKHKNIIIIGY